MKNAEKNLNKLLEKLNKCRCRAQHVTKKFDEYKYGKNYTLCLSKSPHHSSI